MVVFAWILFVLTVIEALAVVAQGDLPIPQTALIIFLMLYLGMI